MNSEKTPLQKTQMKRVMEVVRRNRRFMISSHINPEGDALGSALALGSLIRRLGKEAVVATDGGIPDTFEFFPKPVPVVSQPALRFKPEVAMTVDVPLLARTGSMEKPIRQVPVLVNIDHHVSNQRFGTVNWVDPKAAAVGEMIFRLFRGFKLKPNLEEATCLYVSIVTDTGSFRYMSTTAQVHQIAAELIETGVSPLKVAQDLYECHSALDMKFLGAVLKGIRTEAGGKIAWLEVPHRLLKATRPGPEVVDELVNFPRAVKGAEVAFVLREDEPGKTVRVSFRSKGNVDVNRLANRFGGGGHMAASGCTLQGTLTEARRQVLKAARETLRRVKAR